MCLTTYKYSAAGNGAVSCLFSQIWNAGPTVGVHSVLGLYEKKGIPDYAVCEAISHADFVRETTFEIETCQYIRKIRTATLHLLEMTEADAHSVSPVSEPITLRKKHDTVHSHRFCFALRCLEITWHHFFSLRKEQHCTLAYCSSKSCSKQKWSNYCRVIRRVD